MGWQLKSLLVFVSLAELLTVFPVHLQLDSHLDMWSEFKPVICGSPSLALTFPMLQGLLSGAHACPDIRSPILPARKTAGFLTDI